MEFLQEIRIGLITSLERTEFVIVVYGFISIFGETEKLFCCELDC